MQSLDHLRYSRSILKGYLAELGRLGLVEEVQKRGSAELLPLLDSSLSAPRWLSAAPFDEIMALVATLRGRDAVRGLGHSVMSDQMVTVLEPVMSLALLTFGQTPGSLFSRAHQMASVVSQGVEVIWAPSGHNGGTLRVRMEDPATRPLVASVGRCLRSRHRVGRLRRQRWNGDTGGGWSKRRDRRFLDLQDGRGVSPSTVMPGRNRATPGCSAARRNIGVTPPEISERKALRRPLRSAACGSSRQLIARGSPEQMNH